MSEVKTSTKKRGTPAGKVMDRMFGTSPERQAELEQIGYEMDVAQMIYDLRKEAGLTQTQLADRIGTQQSVISDLEAADYEGHTMPMLRRIAKALGKVVQLRFVDEPQTNEAA